MSDIWERRRLVGRLRHDLGRIIGSDKTNGIYGSIIWPVKGEKDTSSPVMLH